MAEPQDVDKGFVKPKKYSTGIFEKLSEKERDEIIQQTKFEYKKECIQNGMTHQIDWNKVDSFEAMKIIFSELFEDQYINPGKTNIPIDLLKRMEL